MALAGSWSCLARASTRLARFCVGVVLNSDLALVHLNYSDFAPISNVAQAAAGKGEMVICHPS